MPRSLFLVLSLAIAGCASEEAPPSSTASAQVAAFTWPTPAGWRSETIPFPLGFAPSIPYRGVEELRFGPRFFDPTSPTYFTYAFAFVLDDAPAMGPEVLAADLTTYFTGLARAVTGAPSDPKLHSASVDVGADGAMTGVVHTIDAFGDRRPLVLNLEAETFVCGERRIVLASLSPLPKTSPVWQTLTGVRKSFSCQ